MSFELNSFIKDTTLKELSNILNIQGQKILIVDKKILKLFGILGIHSEVLKNQGVTNVFKLKNKVFIIPPNTEHIIYITRPNVQNMKFIALQISYWKSQGKIPNFYLYMSPKSTLLCEKVLEELEITIKIEEFYLDLVPFENDVYSMELDNFRDYFLEGDTSSLYFIARSIMKIYSFFGIPNQIKSKGNGSIIIMEMLERMKKQVNKLVEEDNEIDIFMILDRNIDLITPLLIQLSYEGLLDELYGIDNGFLKKEKMILDSQDIIFSEIRDLNQVYVGNKLKNKANQIEKEMEERKNLNQNSSVQKIKDFSKKVPRIKDEKKSLEIHIKLLQDINNIIGRKAFKKAVQNQQSMILGDDLQHSLEYIEECIHKNDPLIKVLRLLSLFCLTNGLSLKQLDQIKREIIHSYGYDKLIILNYLEKIGFFTKLNWDKIKKGFDLVHEDMDIQTTMNEVHSIYSGYCPILTKIIELGIKSSLKQTKILDLLPGQIKEMDSKKNLNDKKLIFVFIIGGITMSEISTIRFLSKKLNRDIIILTTSIINGDKFIESFLDQIPKSEKVNEKVNDDEFIKIEKQDVPLKFK